ncbi:hypothetical protein JZ751_027736 [Albula glossodonta]|uniref:Uncharacterized protein n=1 Tax=Albula glossodonta TaxID=121402 RepID=A0A8T2P703_9TELE|nr:hypothetical protein JZ751_027736 [Albula glossodonta]
MQEKGPLEMSLGLPGGSSEPSVCQRRIGERDAFPGRANPVCIDSPRTTGQNQSGNQNKQGCQKFPDSRGLYLPYRLSLVLQGCDTQLSGESRGEARLDLGCGMCFPPRVRPALMASPSVAELSLQHLILFTTARLMSLGNLSKRGRAEKRSGKRIKRKLSPLFWSLSDGWGGGGGVLEPSGRDCVICAASLRKADATGWKYPESQPVTSQARRQPHTYSTLLCSSATRISGQGSEGSDESDITESSWFDNTYTDCCVGIQWCLSFLVHSGDSGWGADLSEAGESLHTEANKD